MVVMAQYTAVTMESNPLAGGPFDHVHQGAHYQHDHGTAGETP